MRAEDLDAVMEIERRSFPEPWTPGLFLHELKIPFSKTVLARSTSGELVGYVCWWAVGDEIQILNVAVSPEHRRSGIGSALIDLVMSDAHEKQVRSVTLEVHRDNQSGAALYRSIGFVETGVRKNYYGRGKDAIIMTRQLNKPSTNESSSATSVS